jgi:hypothetical protein
MFGARGGSRSKQSAGVNQYTPDSIDVLLLKQEGAAGRSTVEEYTWMHQRV